jgi:hypothetical protein
MTTSTLVGNTAATAWYWMADLAPSSETITNRLASIAEIEKHVDAADDDALLMLLDFCIRPTGEHEPFLKASFASLRKFDSTISGEITEYFMVIRACLIEAFRRVLKNSTNGPIIASLLVSAASTLETYNSPWAARSLQLLLNESTARLEQLGMTARSLNASTPSPNVVQGYQALSEEIDVLWWCYNKSSSLDGKPYADSPPGTACCAMPVDLAKRIILPPISRIKNILWREANQLSTMKLDWSELKGEYVLSTLTPTQRRYIELSQVLFPVLRLISNLAVPKHLTDLRLSPAEWSVQLLNELLALRMIEINYEA